MSTCQKCRSNSYSDVWSMGIRVFTCMRCGHQWTSSSNVVLFRPPRKRPRPDFKSVPVKPLTDPDGPSAA